MSDKQKARIERWQVVKTLGGGQCLCGNVYGHPKLRDGTYVQTSNLVKIDIVAGTCETMNTFYTLGEESKS